MQVIENQYRIVGNQVFNEDEKNKRCKLNRSHRLFFFMMSSAHLRLSSKVQ